MSLFTEAGDSGFGNGYGNGYDNGFGLSYIDGAGQGSGTGSGYGIGYGSSGGEGYELSDRVSRNAYAYGNVHGIGCINTGDDG